MAGAATGRAPRGHNYDSVRPAWWRSGWRRRRAGSRRSGCCQRPVRRGMPGRTGTSGASSLRRSRRGGASITGAAARRSGRRVSIWSSTGAPAGLHVFCAVLAWSRFRFVRFARDERAETTLAMLAECFEVVGGVPGKVLADRMGCLKGGVVANVVVPTAGYVRFAGHYGFRPDFCEAADPESKGIVENLVGYAKADLMVPQAPFGDLAVANAAAAQWCAEVNAAVHSEICAVPAERLVTERNCLPPCRRCGPASGRCSPARFIGSRPSDSDQPANPCPSDWSAHTFSCAPTTDVCWSTSRPPVRSSPSTSWSLLARRRCSTSTTRPAPAPQRAPRPQTPTEHEFVGPVAEAFVRGAAASGSTRLPATSM